MLCPRCRSDNEEQSSRCVCGFPFVAEGEQEQRAWFDEVRQILQTSYVAAPTSWQQSGTGYSFEDWIRLRVPISEGVTCSGTFLDIGCANGFLLECLLSWTKMKGVEIIPYGLDYAPQLLAMAQKRLPTFKEHLFLGNAWDWQPPRRFTYVSTDAVYVPRNLRFTYLKRLLTEFLEEDGVLLVTDYRSSLEAPSRIWRDEELRAQGFNVVGWVSGFDGRGKEKCRVAFVKKQLS